MLDRLLAEASETEKMLQQLGPLFQDARSALQQNDRAKAEQALNRADALLNPTRIAASRSSARLTISNRPYGAMIGRPPNRRCAGRGRRSRIPRLRRQPGEEHPPRAAARPPDRAPRARPARLREALARRPAPEPGRRGHNSRLLGAASTPAQNEKARLRAGLLRCERCRRVYCTRRGPPA